MLVMATIMLISMIYNNSIRVGRPAFYMLGETLVKNEESSHLRVHYNLLIQIHVHVQSVHA